MGQDGAAQPLVSNQYGQGGPPPQQVMGGMATFDGLPMLHAQQSLDLLEVFCPACEKRNKYSLYLNPEDKAAKRRWGMVKEESSCLARYFCNPHHALSLTMTGPSGQPVLVADKPCTCCTYGMTLREAGSDRVIGSYQQDCKDLLGCCAATTHVNNASGEEMFTIKGPSPCWISLCMPWPCRDPMDFVAMQPGSDNPMGPKVSNVPNGSCKMCFTNADDYDIDFAGNTDRDVRALLVMYTFLLDYMYFQAKDDNKHNDF